MNNKIRKENKKEIDNEGEEIDENELWDEKDFFEDINKKQIKIKMRSFHMKHYKEMNFNCKVCNTKISAHNKDWHNEMCDNCFDKKYFNKNEQKNNIAHIFSIDYDT